MPLNSEQIAEKVDYLRAINQEGMLDRSRIRDIMNGGEAAVRALLGDKMNVEYNQLPAPNLFLTALERFAQKLGRAPDLKVDLLNDNDSQRAKKKSEKVERIVTSYDKFSKLHKQLPQAARWLPGYGFVVWTLTHKRDRNGNPYPYAELQDSFNCYPGNFGNDQEPNELAIIRRVPHGILAEQYPESKQYIYAQNEKQQSAYSVLIETTERQGSWANSTGQGKVVVEFRDKEGTYIFLPENNKIIDFIPNMLSSGPCFVVAKRYSFDQM